MTVEPMLPKACPKCCDPPLGPIEHDNEDHPYQRYQCWTTVTLKDGRLVVDQDNTCDYYVLNRKFQAAMECLAALAPSLNPEAQKIVLEFLEKNK